jgi:cell division septation protein DedD
MRLASVGVILLSLAMLAASSGCSHESRDWHAAQSADTIEAYEEFVKEHPASTRTSDAHARVAELTEERDWQRATSTDTADAYRQFLSAHPQAKSAQEARIRIENFGLNGATPAGAAAPSTAAPPAAVAPPTAASPPAPHPPAAEPGESGTGYGVQLGAFATQAQAQSQWKRVAALYKKELHGALSEIERGKSSSGRHVYRLKAKVESEARARALCVQLKKHAQPCVVVSLTKR